MRTVFIDLETYYTQEYSLSKMTTEEYIRDERFEVILASVYEEGCEPRWFSGPMKETGEWLRSFDLHECFAIAHNALFDMAVLSWHYGIKPARIGDTLSMGRAAFGPSQSASLAALAKRLGLGVKGTEVVRALGKRRRDFSPNELRAYASYCINDTVLCRDLFYAIMEKEEFPPAELPVIDTTVRMFTEPVLKLDLPLLEQHLYATVQKKEQLLARAEYSAKNLGSAQQLADILRALGVEPPMKISPRTGKTTYAFSKTDTEFTSLLEHPDERVQAVVAARLGVKSTLEETRTQRFIGVAHRGALPVPLAYSRAISHRWGGMDYNLQNLPSRGPKEVRTLKYSIKAPEGHYILNSDLSQIEARMLAWLAGQYDLLSDFEAADNYVGDPKHKPDVYKNMAARIYHIAPDQINKQQRDTGKAVILGAGFGMSAEKFALTLKSMFGVEINENEAWRIIDTYREYNSKIVEFWEQCGVALTRMALGQAGQIGRSGALWYDGSDVLLANGLKIRYAGLGTATGKNGKSSFVYTGRNGPVYIFSTKLVENVTQALARCVIAEQMAKISRKHKVVLTVHDAIAVVTPTRDLDSTRSYIERVMRTAPAWAPGLPLNCEVKYGLTYGDC